MQWIIRSAIALFGVMFYLSTAAEPYSPPPGTAYTYTPTAEGASYYSNPTGIQSFYCYQNSRYIKVGMPVSEVLDACGTPKSQHKQKAEQYGKVAVKQWV